MYRLYKINPNKTLEIAQRLYLGGVIDSDLHAENANENERDYNADYEVSIDAIESMILAHACAGVDISSPAYIEGIETAVDRIANEFA